MQATALMAQHGAADDKGGGLDQVTQLDEVIGEVTAGLESYELGRGSRPLALPRGRRAIRVLVGAVLGLLALVVWAVVAVSTVPELRLNELVLVLWPTDLALGFLSQVRGRRYARIRVAVLALCALLSAVGVLRQPLLPFVVLGALPFAVLAFSSQVWRASSTTDATA